MMLQFLGCSSDEAPLLAFYTLLFFYSSISKTSVSVKVALRRSRTQLFFFFNSFDSENELNVSEEKPEFDALKTDRVVPRERVRARLFLCNNATVMLPMNTQNAASLVICVSLQHNDVLPWPCSAIVMQTCHGGSGEASSI